MILFYSTRSHNPHPRSQSLDIETLNQNQVKDVIETICMDISTWPCPPCTLYPTMGYVPVELNLGLLGQFQKYSFAPIPSFPLLFDNIRAQTTSSGFVRLFFISSRQLSLYQERYAHQLLYMNCFLIIYLYCGYVGRLWFLESLF